MKKVSERIESKDSPYKEPGLGSTQNPYKGSSY